MWFALSGDASLVVGVVIVRVVTFIIYNVATCILEESQIDRTIPICPLGRDWVSCFLAANPDIEKCIQKPKDKKRIDAQKREQIEKFFQKIKKVHDEKGILPSRLAGPDRRTGTGPDRTDL